MKCASCNIYSFFELLKVQKLQYSAKILYCCVSCCTV